MRTKGVRSTPPSRASDWVMILLVEGASTRRRQGGGIRFNLPFRDYRTAGPESRYLPRCENRARVPQEQSNPLMSCSVATVRTERSYCLLRERVRNLHNLLSDILN